MEEVPGSIPGQALLLLPEAPIAKINSATVLCDTVDSGQTLDYDDHMYGSTVLSIT